MFYVVSIERDTDKKICILPFSSPSICCSPPSSPAMSIPTTPLSLYLIQRSKICCDHSGFPRMQDKIDRITIPNSFSPVHKQARKGEFLIFLSGWMLQLSN